MALVRLPQRMRMVTPVVAPTEGAGAAGATAILVVAAPVVAATRAEDKPKWNDREWALGAAVIIAAGWLIALVVNALVDPAVVTLAEGITVFALFYVAAQAIERLLEPFASAFGTTRKEKEDVEKAIEEASVADEASVRRAAQNVAKAQDKVEEKRDRRTVLITSAAIVAGMIASGVLGLYLLDTMIAGNPPPKEFDIFVTGLTIGGGTKPLHDLIKKIEKSKEQDEKPPEVT